MMQPLQGVLANLSIVRYVYMAEITVMLPNLIGRSNQMIVGFVSTQQGARKMGQELINS